MIVLFWSRATRDLLRSFGWGIAALHRLHAATKLPRPRRPPHSVYRFRVNGELTPVPDSPLEGSGFELVVPQFSCCARPAFVRRISARRSKDLDGFFRQGRPQIATA